MPLSKKLFIQFGENALKLKKGGTTNYLDEVMEKELEQERSCVHQETGGKEKKLTIDLLENETSFIILALVAGIPYENLSVFLDTDILTIFGEAPKNIHDLGKPVYKECGWGKFSRSITLPKNIKRQGYKATLKNGLLTIILPKLKNIPSKKINIVSHD